MRKYVITMTSINGRTMTWTTANSYFAKHLMQSFVANDKVADVRMKVVRGNEGQMRLGDRLKPTTTREQTNNKHNTMIITT